MMPKLYYSPLSPAARSVLILAKAIDLPLELIEISLAQKEQLRPEFLKINPEHTVPTLVDSDGYVLWDSHAILPYLVDKYAKTDELYPNNLQLRGIISQRLHLDTGFSKLRRIILHPLLYAGDTNFPEERIKEILDYYDFIEKHLKRTKWIASDNVTIADISLIPSVLVTALVVPIDINKYPKTAEWLQRGRKLPYFFISEEGHAKLKSLILSKLE